MTAPPLQGSPRKHRRYERLQAQLPVTFKIGEQRLEFETADVSLSGMMIQGGGEDLPLNQLLNMEAHLDDGLGVLKLFVMAVRHIPPQPDTLPAGGVGLVLYANGEDATKRWHHTVRGMAGRKKPKSAHRATPERPAATAAAEPLETSSRQPHQSIPFEDSKALKFFAKQLLKRGAFRLQLTHPWPEDAEIHVILIHPKTQDRLTLQTTLSHIQDNVAVAKLHDWNRPSQQRLVDFVNQSPRPQG